MEKHKRERPAKVSKGDPKQLSRHNFYKNYLEGMRLPGFVLDDWFLSGGKEWPLLNLTGV